MILPVGHDQGELRRWPVVSFAVIGLCALVAVTQPGPDRAALRSAGEDITAAITYYFDNPDLDLAPRAQVLLDQLLAREDPDVRREIRRRLDEAGSQPRGDREGRQAILDKYVAGWWAVVSTSPVWRWGLIPADIKPAALLTYMFVHSGWLHLLSNLLILYLAGPFIEDVWGRGVFGAFYAIGGVVAALLFALQERSMAAPLVGASGAIAGVMGAFLVRYPTAKIKFLWVLPPRPFTFSVRAWIVLSLWFASELMSARAATRSAIGATQVAYWAHVWGFAFGVAVAGVLRAFRLEDRLLFEAIERKREANEQPVLHQVEQMLKRGQQREAAQLLAAALLRAPHDQDLAAAYWQLARIGPMTTQPAVCLRIIQNDLARGDEPTAIERWEEFHTAAPNAQPDAALTVQLARCLAKHGRRDEAAALVAETCRRVDGATPPPSLVELARFTLEMDFPLPEAIGQRVMADPRIPAGAKNTIRQLLRWRSPRGR
jgi:membrane associated rhomboid family serine protease